MKNTIKGLQIGLGMAFLLAFWTNAFSAGTLEVTPAAHVYGAAVLDTVGGSRVFVASAVGGAVTMDAIGTTDPNFTMTTNTTKQCVGTLNEGEACNFEVVFTPVALGVRLGKADLHSDATNADQKKTISVFLQGAGTVGTPTNVVASPAGSTSLSVAFTEVFGASGYTATCGTSFNSGTVSPIIVSGLVTNTSYACTVVATGSTGGGVPSAPSVGAPSAGTTAYAPTSPSAAVASSTSIRVSFTPPSSFGTGAFIKYIATCGSNTGESSSSSATSILVNNLSINVPYTCTVNAVTGVGTGGVATANPLTLTLPSAPISVSATNGSASNSIQVTFSSGGLGTGSLVNYTADCGGFTSTSTSSPITVTNAGLANGTSYDCKVKATTLVGDGPWSSPLVAAAPLFSTTLCGTAANSLLTTTTNGSTTLVNLVNSNVLVNLGLFGQNNRYQMNAGRSLSLEFKFPLVGSVGQKRAFKFEIDTIGNLVPLFLNISTKQCDFSYAQIDSLVVAGFNSKACSGNQVIVQNPGDAPVYGFCSVEPGKTYYLNMRNEDATIGGKTVRRGLNSCIYNSCGFVWGLQNL